VCEQEFRARAARLRLVLTDVDGVLTDAGVYYSAEGEALKRFSVRDGMGVELLRRAGVDTAVVTREDSPIVARRAKKLALPYVYLGVRDKFEHLPVISLDSSRELNEMAYIGDDLNDLEIMQAIRQFGLLACPADAMLPIQRIVHYRCSARGGYGAFREFADWLLALRH
jgi:3-deoxy-D-manno-octulosonate 8-phosphate phosphatase (KDO 8-P phosphatase)